VDRSDSSGNKRDSTVNPIDTSGVDTSNIVRIYSITPSSGFPNTTVIIKGANFNSTASDNLVKFNNGIATVVLASKDSLVVTAPMDGTTGAVTVTAGGKTATGPFFTYLHDSVDVYATVRGDGVIYWKNAEEYFLSSVQNNIGGAYGIAISQSNVYIAGSANYIAGIWKNGVETVLPVSSSNSITEAKAIVVSDNDLYVAGSDAFIPVYWKNSIEHKLPVTGGGFINSIAINGSDVYAAGYTKTSTDNLVYWKNGVEKIIGNSTVVNGGAMCIAVSGVDVYICGTDSGAAAYWKNDVKVILSKSSGGEPAEANALALSANDLYIVGYYNGSAVYWKNGIKFTLPSLSYSARATCIYIYNSDIYIGGSDGNSAVYWENGIEYHLGSIGYVTSMAIIKP
jgi:hypothetical protein